ncbi:MAG: tRNA (adenosine(37)-N6)-threonylcarbamoyltransferase complex dimerization subunit type 1 TsaB [Clostridia bacterium]|nr:tRNA (adenosine(37)-N6)-threonylcarbamoyltransferase complex dimerization subunit type 1 TsaB [Clostridia bacterium]
MIILSFNSTAKVASVAVADGERLLCEYSIDNGLTQSELLLPMAENALKCLRLDFSDVELLASSVGPGSFTGVRIGTSLVKGIAFGKNIPCVSVSTLDALAENLRGIKGLVVPVMDAKRNQVYTAIFRSDENSLVRLCEDKAISIDSLADELLSFGEERVYLVGDGAFVTERRFKEAYPGVKLSKTPELLIRQSAYSVARVAYRKYLLGQSERDTEHMPTYLRLPQAERERLQRLRQEEKNKTE